MARKPSLDADWRRYSAPCLMLKTGPTLDRGRDGAPPDAVPPKDRRGRPRPFGSCGTLSPLLPLRQGHGSWGADRSDNGSFAARRVFSGVVAACASPAFPLLYFHHIFAGVSAKTLPTQRPTPLPTFNSRSICLTFPSPEEWSVTDCGEGQSRCTIGKRTKVAGAPSKTGALVHKRPLVGETRLMTRST